jgi:hypothetical protein
VYAALAGFEWFSLAHPAHLEVLWWGQLLAIAPAAGISTAWCLSPVILWVHGQHPRQLLWRRTGRDR